MSIQTETNLRSRADGIANETSQGANTATRVGSWMRDAFDTLWDKIGTPINIQQIATMLQGFIPISQKGVANGVASLGVDGKVLGTQLPAILVNVTKSQLDNLISTNALTPGATYKITGVHPTLYNDGTNLGTTIFLKALSTNQLEKKGHGEFYNPKYDKNIAGFGVWNNRSTWATSNIVGTFEANELITANNGATGQLFTTIDANIFIALTGNWNTATAITGNVSGATADVGTIVLKTFAIGSKAIWGGYSWTNVNGNVGNKVDILNLNTEWTKDGYSLTNYNKVLDSIEYDYTNDWILSRHELEGNNKVIFTKSDSDFFIDIFGFNQSGISVFMFGNVFDYNLYSGLNNNIITNSYFECVDFCGSSIYNNNLSNYSNIYNNNLSNSSIYDNNLSNYSNIYNNNLSSGSIYNNNLSSSNINNNNLSSGSIYNNNLSSSSIESNNLSSSSIESNNLNNSSIYNNNLSNSNIQINTLSNSSNIQNNNLSNYSNIYNNNLSNSNINNNNLSNSSIYDNNLSISYIYDNNLSISSIKTNTLSGSYIDNNTLSNSIINTNNLSNSSINTNNLSGSYINNNTLSNSNIQNNTLSNNSYIYTNTLSNSSINTNNLSNSYIYDNNLSISGIQIGISNTLTNKKLLFVTLENATINIPINSATIIFGDYPKTIYKKPNGTFKMRYFDDSDNLVIVNIDA